MQGFIWDLNSFDQWGVELGKALGKRVRLHLNSVRNGKASGTQFNSSTDALLARFLGN